MKKVVKVLAVVAVVFVLLIAVIVRVTSSWELPEAVTADVNLSLVADGVYTGEYTAQPVKAVVTVQVSDKRITDIVINEHRNGKGKPAEQIVSEIIEQQSLLVDAVSGATHSSNVILRAVEDALTR